MRMWALARLWMALTLILLVMAQSRWKYHAYTVAAEAQPMNGWQCNLNEIFCVRAKNKYYNDCIAFDIGNTNAEQKTRDEKNIQIFMCTYKLHTAYE